MSQPVSIGGRYCGGGHPVFIVFEAGPTVEGVESARQLVAAAAAAGADAIKFQILDSARLVGQKDLTITYTVRGDGDDTEAVTEPLEMILQRRALSRAEWTAVKRHADALGITFFATVDYAEQLAFVRALGCHAVKICSGDVTHLSWLAEVARAGLPVMIDTGMATLGEIETAAETIWDAGAPLLIHHCPSGYPARLTSINLRMIPMLQHLFPATPICFSDHTPGWDMDIAAVALGAAMVEKTLTLDRRTRSPEHIMSVEPSEAGAFVRAIRDLEVALGQPRRVMTQTEARSKLTARRSLFLIEDVRQGDPLTFAVVDWQRPGSGIGPSVWPYAAGRRFGRDLAKGSVVTWGDLA